MRSWYSLARGTQHRYDLYSINTLFLAFAFFIVIAIAYRSTFWADRVAFGALAVGCALVVARALSSAPGAIFAMNFASAFMWTIAAVVAMLALLRGFRAPSQE
jgi:hypothetical protein